MKSEPSPTPSVSWKNYWESFFTPLTAAILISGFLCLAVPAIWRGCNFDYEKQTLERQLDAIQRGEASQLDLHYSHGTDAVLAKAACLPALTRVWLDKTDVTNDGIKQLSKSPNLKTLTIWKGRIDDKAIDFLSSARNLEELELGTTPISDEGIRKLQQLPHLQTLTIEYYHWTADKPLLTDLALKHLAQVPHIKRITLLGAWYSLDALADLRAKLPNTIIDTKDDDAKRRVRSTSNKPMK